MDLVVQKRFFEPAFNLSMIDSRTSKEDSGPTAWGLEWMHNSLNMNSPKIKRDKIG